MSELERLVTGACREQPPLQAPPTLVPRVLREIERRATLPWWRRSFGHWPLPVRVAFTLACAALAASLFTPPLARLALTAAAPIAWLYQAGASAVLLNTVFSHVGGDLAHSLAPHGVYVSLAGISALYLLLAGLFATTYRTLYASR